MERIVDAHRSGIMTPYVLAARRGAVPTQVQQLTGDSMILHGVWFARAIHSGGPQEQQLSLLFGEVGGLHSWTPR